MDAEIKFEKNGTNAIEKLCKHIENNTIQQIY